MSLHAIRITVIASMCVVSGPTLAAEASTPVTVTMSIPLDDARTALEAAIPSKIERLGATEFDGGWGFRYGAWRSPIQISGQGNTLTIATRIEFVIEVCKQIPRPFSRGSFCQPVGSCGYGNDPRAVVDVSTTVAGSWNPDWSIAGPVTVNSTTVRPCRMTILNINVTDRAVGVLRAGLEAEARRMWERLQLRREAERAWAKLGLVNLGKGTWLVWRANDVRVGPIEVRSSAITSRAEIDVDVSVVTSAVAPPVPALPSSLTISLP